ncbi:radical SAM protein [Anaerosporobacter sp.]|uniref:radical SAM protein n=1 Tax=Anaerosporobacter sp. TaxID=1872529 RepID=UPI00286FAA7C|nr:radical SAM protein [Anaerosporobacter sp.]
MKSLFVEQFDTRNNNHYIFDVNTSVVIPDNKIMSECLELLNNSYGYDEVYEVLRNKYDEEQVCSTVKFVQRWEKIGGFFKEESKDSIPLANEELIKHEFDNGLTFMLVINVTEDCNFRCKYCYLSEEYEFTRNRTSRQMDYDVAIKGIDTFFEYLHKIKEYIPNKKAAITFYGGEPLLEFELVKKLTEYINKNKPVPIVFNMTTNAYHMTEEVGDFIVENNFHVAVSLDGSEKNHNRNRVLAGQKGTYEKVIQRLSSFSERHKDYLNIGLISVYDVKTDLNDNLKFFNEKKIPRILFTNEVSSTNTNYYDRFDESDYKIFQEEYNKLLETYIEKRQRKEKMDNYTQMMIESRLIPVILRTRHLDKKASVTPYTNTCLPGMKISVRVDGTLDLCERINYCFPLGNVEEGLDYSKISEVINQYNHDIVSECNDCIAYRNCPLCYAYTNSDGCFKKEKDFCEKWVNEQKKKFQIVYSILESNPDAFAEAEIALTESFIFRV